MVNQEQAAGDTHSTLVYQVSMKAYAFMHAQCLTNSCFCVVCQITEVMSREEEREQRYAIQFIHRQGKNRLETLHAIQTTYREGTLLRTPFSLFFARYYRRNLIDHATTTVH